MLYALGLLAISGGGAWLLAYWSLDYLAALASKLNQIWPLAYFAYLALAVLAITPLGMAMVVALKSFRITGLGGSGLSADGDGGDDDKPESGQ